MGFITKLGFLVLVVTFLYVWVLPSFFPSLNVENTTSVIFVMLGVFLLIVGFALPKRRVIPSQ
ncbi:MAG: hypothetical protein AABX79_02025 [Nanoarchaeota archaeon]